MKLKSMQLIHRFLCTGILLFAGVVLFINKETMHFSFDSAEPLLFIGPAMAIGMLIVAPIISGKMLQNAAAAPSVDAKLGLYQTSFIIRSACYEAAALFNIVCFLKTSNVLFMVFAALAFFALWASKPTLAKAALKFGIPESELANGI